MPSTNSITLHSALDSYAEFARQTLRQSTFRTICSRLNAIKSHHVDLPLSNLTASAIMEILHFWANRPITSSGKRCASMTAQCLMRVFLRFLRWLDLSNAFEWTMPTKVRKYKIRPVKLREDAESFPQRNPPFTPQQIGNVYQSATIVDRAFLLLGINCAMSAAVIARLRRSDFIDGDKVSEWLPTECNAGESVVVARKHETGHVQTILLWKETADALRAVLQRSQASEFAPLFHSANDAFK